MIEAEDRLQLRRTLKWSLRSDSWRRTESQGVTKPWYDKKLDGMLAYGLVKEQIPRRTLKIMRLHFDQGLPLDKIAFNLKLSTRQVSRDVNRGLDVIIDNVPRDIIVSLSPDRYTWLLKACPNCGGNMYWDPEGAHGQGGEYCCLLCGCRKTIQEMEDYQMEKRKPGD